MTSANRGGARSEDSPQGLIERLLRELGKEQPNDSLLDSLRASLLDMRETYVFPLVARIRHARTEDEAVRLVMLIQILADPRLLQCLEAIAKDPKASPQAVKIAEIALLNFGVAGDLDRAIDPAMLTKTLPEELRSELDGFVAMLEGKDRETAFEGLAALVTTGPAALSDALLGYMVRHYGERILPALEYLAGSPDAQAVMRAVAGLKELRHPGALRILERVAERPPDLATGLEARAAAERLRSQGVLPLVQVADTEPRPTPERWTIRRALLSSIDGVGSRMIALECALPNGKAAVVDVCLNDTVGLKDCAGKEGQPKQIARDIERIRHRAPEGMRIEEADAAYCLWLIYEAKQRNATSHFPMPIGYHSWLTPLGPPRRQFDAPLCYQFLDANQIEHDDDRLDTSEMLLDEPELRSWLFNPEEIGPWAEQLRQAFSRNDEDAEERIVSEAAARLLTMELRHLYARRLEEMAYLYWLGARKQLAAQCLHVAGRLHSETIPITSKMREQ